ncbi:pectin lyase fold/virulence factor, partial [Fomes fomentarius]
GIDKYRSDRISLLRWDITCGDDCLAIKGNSTNIVAKDITCRGGNGIAFGSLGQYVQFNDIVNNVLLEDLNLIRLDSQVQPNMVSGVYFKSWDGTVTRRVTFDQVTLPIGGHSDGPSTLRFSNLTFEDWVGTAQRNTKAR